MPHFFSNSSILSFIPIKICATPANPSVISLVVSIYTFLGTSGSTSIVLVFFPKAIVSASFKVNFLPTHKSESSPKASTIVSPLVLFGVKILSLPSIKTGTFKTVFTVLSFCGISAVSAFPLISQISPPLMFSAFMNCFQKFFCIYHLNFFQRKSSHLMKKKITHKPTLPENTFIGSFPL